MASVRPTEDPTWATGKAHNAAGSPTGDVITPTAGKRVDGWPAPQNSPLPYQTINFLWKILGDFVAHFRDFASSFPELQDAVAGLAVDEVGFVDSFDPTDAPGELEQIQGAFALPGLSTVPEIVAVDVDGQYVWIFSGGASSWQVQRRNRENLSIAAAIGAGSFNVTNSGPTVTEMSLVTNGKYVAVALENSVDLHLASDGSQVWTYPHGGAVNDLAIDHEAVYLVGATGTDATSQARRILFTKSGTLIEADSDWDFAHGATLLAVDVDGQRCFVGGLASGGHSMSSLNRTTGFQGAADPLTWNGPSSLSVERRSLRTDGSRIFMVENNGGTRTIYVRGVVDGAQTQSLAVGSVAPIGHACVDQSFYYLPLDGVMTAYDKSDLAVTIKYDHRGILVAELYGVASDGDRIFICGEESDPAGTSDDNLTRITRGGRGQRWTRVDPATARALPMRQLIIPEGP